MRFHVDLPSLWCAHCHCSMCRMAHGAGFVTWVGMRAEAFHVDTGAELLTAYESSPGALRRFCRSCGSTLTFESVRWPGEVHLTLANFTTSIDREPQVHSYWDSRVEWADWHGRELPTSEPG